MMYLSENLSPQGTKLGPWLFLTVIKDLVVKNARLWKYVDNTISYTIIMIPYILLLYALEVVDSVKLLGLNTSSDLTWNIYIDETVKKGSKRFSLSSAKTSLYRREAGEREKGSARGTMGYPARAFWEERRRI